MVSQPQTPRLKTKLSLDIPANYSGGMIPDSPTSQFTASPFNGSVPASPTFSVSNKSPAELTVMLKDAYNTIRDKERDLTLAAEIGKSLLDNNITLKAKYENALAQLTNYQRQQSKNAIFSIQHQQATPIAPPSTSLGTIDDEYDESDSESLFGYSTSFDTSSQSGDLPHKRKNHQNSTGMSYKDLEKIKDLEARNQELQLQLDEAVREYGESNKTKSSKIRKLEYELQHFQDQCALATQKIEDITRDNERLLQKQKESFWDHKYNKTKSNDNDDFIEALLHKIQELEEQNRSVEKTKTEIERKLLRTSTDLEALKVEFEEMAETSKDYEVLRLENHEKGKLIEELTENLEEQRALVVNYQSGIWSQKTSRANSISDGSLMANTLRRLSDPDGFGMRGMFGAPPKQEKIKKSLLSEIENEFFQMFQRGDKRDVDSRLTSPAFSPITSEKDLKNYFEMGSHDDLDYLSDDAFSFLGEFDLDNEKENRIREWFWKRWIKAIFRFLRMIWRWCRFLFILVAAVLMAIYRGPDDILPDEM